MCSSSVVLKKNIVVVVPLFGTWCVYADVFHVRMPLHLEMSYGWDYDFFFALSFSFAGSLFRV